MTLSVDIKHWLDADGELPRGNPRLRRRALRIVRFIECGALLPKLHGRETLIECTWRSRGTRGQPPKGKVCAAFLVVAKRPDDIIEVCCPVCQNIEAFISGWQDTLWANGPMEPVLMLGD